MSQKAFSSHKEASKLIIILQFQELSTNITAAFTFAIEKEFIIMAICANSCNIRKNTESFSI